MTKLKTPIGNYIGFDPEAEDLNKEVERINTFLDTHCIDLMILGLGMNGHLGLNEPNAYVTLPAHIAQLNPVTKTHDMVKGLTLTRGMSIGMKGIFESRQVVMLICGEHKEEAYQAFMSQNITTQIPASFLWLHSNCTCIIDREQFPKDVKNGCL